MVSNNKNHGFVPRLVQRQTATNVQMFGRRCPTHQQVLQYNLRLQRRRKTVRRSREEDNSSPEITSDNEGGEFVDVDSDDSILGEDVDLPEMSEEQIREACQEDFAKEDEETQIPSELQETVGTRAQEQDAYMMINQSPSKWKDGRPDLEKLIDKIHPKLVAKFRVHELFYRIKTNSAHQFENLKKAMSILHGDASYVVTNSEAVRAARMKKKISDTPKPMKPMVAAALRYLMNSSRFLIGTVNPRATIGVDPVTDCGAFFIKKSNGKLRVILDGRWANVYFKSEDTAFNYFRLETLRNVLGNLSQHERWFALNYDLRHWFHQIPLPKCYCKYLGMKLTDRHTSQDKEDFWAFPRSLPMGFISSLVSSSIPFAALI